MTKHGERKSSTKRRAWLERADARGRDAARAVALVGLLLTLELVVVYALNAGKFAGLWEVQWGTLWLVLSTWCVAGVIGLLGASVGAACGSPRVGRRITAAVVLAGLTVFAAWTVTSGRHFEPLWRRVGVVLLCGAAVLALVLWIGPRLAGWQRTHPLRLGIAVSGLLVLLSCVNRWALVRLYPTFHLVLAVACLALVATFAIGLRPSWPRRGGRFWLVGVASFVIVGLLMSPWTGLRLARFDNVRWILAEQAPIHRELLRWPMAWVPRDIILVPSVDVEPTRSSSALSLIGRDILLVTVDALRADHVGSYGYARNTTPNLDALASSGIRFHAAYCPTPHTSYSITSMMTGKYIRPLLLQDIGGDSETWATHLRRYGYRTAAFHPPAIFFIDRQRFQPFDESNLGFEYSKREFLEGGARVQQVVDYLRDEPADTAQFVWVHLFAPHEPYEAHAEFQFGDRDIDRYDSEVAFADATLGRLVAAFRERKPDGVVIVTADHGEEFGDHGGRYHGTTVYEEQVRVPLIIDAPGAIQPRVVHEPVQTIDLLPTLLSAIDVPVRPRIRGRDLGSLIAGTGAKAGGFAYAETDGQAMLARESWRLVCERQIGACKLFDVARDPGQLRDASNENRRIAEQLRKEMRALNASHLQYEQAGLRAEGKGWPAPLLRALAGDGDALPEVAELLDDADRDIRRKAAEVLFRHRHPETAPALRLSVQRDEDIVVRNYAALALTRLGEGAARTGELLASDEILWRRYAALALAEQGDDQGEEILIQWWMTPAERDHETSLALLDALATIRAKDAAWPLSRSLADVRLRPAIARALARIGDESARGLLARALEVEPYQGTREVLAQALLDLGAENELVVPLRRWLGVPDPISSGLSIASRAGILEYVGGPRASEQKTLAEQARLGALVTLTVPSGGNGKGVRILVEARNTSRTAGRVLVGKPVGVFSFDIKGERIRSRKVPEIHSEQRVALEYPGESEARLRWADAPPEVGLAPGRATHLVVFAEPGIEVLAVAAVPRQDELSLGHPSEDSAGASERNGRSLDENP